MAVYNVREQNPNWNGGRVTSGRYARVLVDGHPRANRYGYVHEHIIIAERVLGRHIPIKHPIHHADGNRKNNSPSNLVVCEDNAYHKFIEMRLKAYRASGNPNFRKCYICKEWKPPEEFYKNGSSSSIGPCKDCNKVKQGRYRSKHRDKLNAYVRRWKAEKEGRSESNS